MSSPKSQALVNAIKGKGFTMQQAAEKLGISRQHLYAQLGKAELDTDFVQNVKRMLTVEIEFVKGEPVNGGGRFSLHKVGKPYLKEVDGFGGNDFKIERDDLQEYITDYIYIPEFARADMYINVRGHSMYPKYASGEIISLRKVQDMSEIQYGQVYLVVTEENRVIKYVRKGKDDKHLLLVSENPKFDPYEIERKKVRAMFLVLGKISKDVL